MVTPICTSQVLKQEEKNSLETKTINKQKRERSVTQTNADLLGFKRPMTKVEEGFGDYVEEWEHSKASPTPLKIQKVKSGNEFTP